VTTTSDAITTIAATAIGPSRTERRRSVAAARRQNQPAMTASASISDHAAAGAHGRPAKRAMGIRNATAISAGSSRHAVSAVTPSSGINRPGSGGGAEAVVNSSPSDRVAPAAAPARGSSETRTCRRGAAVNTVRKACCRQGRREKAQGRHGGSSSA
jgi:hypothetical protein